METEFSKKFSCRLAKLLKAKGVTKQDFADDLGCSCVTVRHWLNGKIPFAVYMLKYLHKEYGVDLNKLLEDI